jgi:hypothetical protein
MTGCHQEEEIEERIQGATLTRITSNEFADIWTQMATVLSCTNYGPRDPGEVNHGAVRRYIPEVSAVVSTAKVL